MTKERPAKKHRTLPTLEGVAAALDRLSNQMLAGFIFFGERVGALEIRMDSLEFGIAACNSKIEGVHRRIDDIVDTRAKRDELAATNLRVTRIEGHLGLA